MFYVASSVPESIMDITLLVQKKLLEDEVCLQCVECTLISEGKRSSRFAAVVEHSDEYGLFIFSSSRVPCLRSDDLILEQTIPIDSCLRCHAEAPQKENKSHPDFLLKLQSPDINIGLEMPQQENTQMFLAELRRAQDYILNMQSQNSAFGQAPDFSWLAKYSKPQQPKPTAATPSSDNPFADDVFDPLKHMNLEQTNSHVLVTDVTSNTQTTWFNDDVAALRVGKDPNSSRQDDMIQSWGSMDMLNSPDEMTDSVDSLQKQLGLTPGTELPIGTKPIGSREKFVRQILSDREDEFTDIKSFKVFCGSWNVNDQSPADPLHKWIVVDNDPPDIYAIGFQELDLSKEAFIFSDSAKEVEWQTVVKKYLHPKAKYRKVKSIRLVGVLLIVFINEKHVDYVKGIDSDSVGTGLMGFVGNKGGVAVRFSLHSTTFCFINSHLAAHQDEYERRNQDYRDIDAKIKFKKFQTPLEVSGHDVVFWIGDLNYRIDLPIEDVKSCIRKGMYKRLWAEDQLIKQMNADSDVFKGYNEGLLKFDPTYRYDTGTDTYDTSEKCRIPAWCDRILWRGPEITQLRYDSHTHFKVSDHKPVSSLFKTGVRVIDQMRHKQVYEDIMKKLDRLENDCLPQIKLDKVECLFKDVKFIESQIRVVTIANIGQRPVEFEFINKLDDKTYCRPWLTITPSKSIITSGSFCEVIMEVYVNKNTASKLNSGEEKLEDILVLHLTDGKDSFITVSGNYLPSSFGSSVEALIQMRTPIRQVPVDDLLQIEQPGSLNSIDISQDGGRLYMVPKEIWKLVDFLHRHGLDKEFLFQQPGRNSEIYQIRDCLDTGVPELIPEVMSIHSVAESMLMFLESLAQPVIPFEFQAQCLSSSNNLLLSKQLISHLPDCHKNLFQYICAFLRETLQYTDKNGLDIKFLATMFGEVMLRSMPVVTNTIHQPTKEQRAKMREEKAKKAAFLYLFLSQDPDAAK